MSAELKMSESTLYEIWQKQIFHDSFKTIIGEKIDVVDSGVMNGETAGPDFKNARIRIGNLTYIGDIEIDLDYSDWKTHGHNIDNKYNKVVLHAALFNRNNHGYVYTRSGRKVPSICLSEYLDKDVLTEFKHQLANEKSNTSQKFKCIDANDVVTAEKKEKFLSQLGIERFQKKCKRMYNRLKELQFLKELNVKEPIIAYELSAQFHERKFKNSEYNSKEIWQQLLYEMIFEALGYSKNKAPMTSLAHIANVNFLQRIEKDGVLVEKYEAALFYISGLAHSVESASEKNTKEYIERIYLHWNALKPFYDSKYMEETQWHFFKLRPQNFPTIRLAAGARILNEIIHESLINKLIKKITEIHNLTVLINSLRSLFVIKSDGFWKNHYVFDQPAAGEVKYFIGASRADEIVVNVIIPFFTVYFEVFGNSNAVKKLLKVYSIYEQRSENQIITEVSAALNLTKQLRRTILSQGMIDLFRNFCSKNKCLECEIGKTIFN